MQSNDIELISFSKYKIYVQGFFFSIDNNLLIRFKTAQMTKRNPRNERDEDYEVPNGHRVPKWSRWSEEQNKMYIKFLKLYQEEFKDDTNLKLTRLYKKMSIFFKGTLTNIQCRSHHQKLLNKYHTIPAIISILS